MLPLESQQLTAKATVNKAWIWQCASSGTPSSLQIQLHPLTFSGEEPGAKAALAKVVTGEAEILAALIPEAAYEQPGSFFPFESNSLWRLEGFPIAYF